MVTEASSCIGLATARNFAKVDTKVVLAARSNETLDAAEELRQLGREARARQLWISSRIPLTGRI